MNSSTEQSKAWSAILCLTFAAFVFNTTEFIPVGLLPNIAASFSINVAHAGLLVTIYAWVVSLLSLPLTVITNKINRRTLLVLIFGVFIVSHLLAGFAWSFDSLAAARIGIACAHSVFWAITTPLAVRLAPKGQKAKAMSFIVMGTSMAVVLGIPIGTKIGQLAGWRVTFLCIAATALIVMALLIYLLPSVPNQSHIPLKKIPSVLKRPLLLNIYLLTAIIITGHFTAYTYISPFMQKVGGFSENIVVNLLLVAGLSGIIGSIIFTKYSSRFPEAIYVIPIITLLMTLLSINTGVSSIYSVILLCLTWGLSVTIISMVMQSKIIAAAPDASDIATSVYSGIYNIGIGGGAFVGSQVLVLLSITDIGLVGAVFVGVALLLFCFVSRRYW